MCGDPSVLGIEKRKLNTDDIKTVALSTAVTLDFNMRYLLIFLLIFSSLICVVSQELLPYSRNGVRGYVNEQGKIIIPARFYKANHFYENKVAVTQQPRRGQAKIWLH